MIVSSRVEQSKWLHFRLLFLCFCFYLGTLCLYLHKRGNVGKSCENEKRIDSTIIWFGSLISYYLLIPLGTLSHSYLQEKLVQSFVRCDVYHMAALLRRASCQIAWAQYFNPPVSFSVPRTTQGRGHRKYCLG